jgi:outer membrane protein OmpA-like peptidoglycan-associated protein
MKLTSTFFFCFFVLLNQPVEAKLLPVFPDSIHPIMIAMVDSDFANTENVTKYTEHVGGGDLIEEILPIIGTVRFPGPYRINTPVSHKRRDSLGGTPGYIDGAFLEVYQCNQDMVIFADTIELSSIQDYYPSIDDQGQYELRLRKNNYYNKHVEIKVYPQSDSCILSLEGVNPNPVDVLSGELVYLSFRNKYEVYEKGLKITEKDIFATKNTNREFVGLVGGMRKVLRFVNPGQLIDPAWLLDIDRDTVPGNKIGTIFSGITMDSIRIGDSFSRDILYAYDSAELLPAGMREIEKLRDILMANPHVLIDLRSHADCRGSDAYNYSLSDRRAFSARDYFVSLGVPERRITCRGMGESEPINVCKDGSSCSEEEHAMNRRTEIVITGVDYSDPDNQLSYRDMILQE